jgi:methylthioribose-1-phosphate isomerase
VANAGSVIGAAESLRRSSAEAARELLSLGLGPPTASAARLADLTPEAEVFAGPSFHSPYRFDGDAVIILDQRALPGRSLMVACRDASEVGSAIHMGAINRGPVLGPLAAYALAMTAATNAARPQDSRRRTFAAAANTLRAARPEVHAITWAVQRMARRYAMLEDAAADGAEAAAALSDEADTITSEAAAAHARLGQLGAEALPVRAGRPLNLLMHADMGPLSCGLVGTGMAVVQALVATGREVHVWLAEARPSMEGSRLSALQMAQSDVRHTVVADSAVAWLLERGMVDAVLLRADRVSANGDVAALVGSLGVARLASAAGVPVHACAPESAIDSSTQDGAELAAGLPVPAPAAGRLEPTVDIVPAAVITSFFTETGAAPAIGQR